jgi:predicted cupin superfamily sugar epimerase
MFSPNCASGRTELEAVEIGEAMNSVNARSAAEIIECLGLLPHPEGGFYREVFRDSVQTPSGRAVSTLIYFLLEAGQSSHWHRVDAVEVWHFYAGAPLALRLSANGRDTVEHRLGKELFAGERPQAIVPAGWWQSARSTGAWTLTGCGVAPGFEFAGFELAPRDWRPS